MKISKEVKVGLLAVIAFTILYIGVKFLRGIDFFSPANSYYVVYSDIDGLTVSNPVIINGYNVGRVDEILILQQHDNKIQVKVDIDNDIIIGEGTEAVLTNSSLLGGKSIILNIKNLERPLIDGDTLVAKTSKGITEEIQERLLPVSQSLDSTIRLVNDILHTIASNKDHITNTVRNFEATSGSLKNITQENQTNFRNIASNLSNLSSSLNDPNDGLKPLLGKINNLADSLNQVKLNATMEEATRVLANLKDITEKLNSRQGSMGKLINEDSLHVNLNRTLVDLDKLLNDLRQNPKKYVHFSIWGAKEKKE